MHPCSETRDPIRLDAGSPRFDLPKPGGRPAAIVAVVLCPAFAPLELQPLAAPPLRYRSNPTARTPNPPNPGGTPKI